MNDRQDQLGAHLRALAMKPGVHGAAVVSRDGICVMDELKPGIHKETFSAMSATLMGAAEVALADLGKGPLRRVFAETDDLKMVVVGATPDLVLVVLADPSASVDDLLPLVDAGAADVAKIVPG